MDYPNVTRRYLAAVIDGFVILGLFYLVWKSPFYDLANTVPIVVFVMVFLYEPVFTSRLCTLGQLLMRYRVRKMVDHSRIGVLQAMQRYVVKIILGIISMLTIPFPPFGGSLR